MCDTRAMWRWVLAAAAVAIGGAPALAQAPVSPQRPPISPYLNLLRAGNSPALNYYGLVRPEQQMRQSIGNLQGGLTANQQAVGNLRSELQGVPVTGHPTQFLNLGGYFMNNGGASGVGAGIGQRPNVGAAGVGRPQGR